MRALFVVLCGLLAAGCATVPAPGSVESFLADDRFAPPREPIRPQAVFQLSDAMRAFARERMQPRVDLGGVYTGIFTPLRDEVFVDYDAAVTRTAAETFEARAGNCLSATIMLAAFAKEFGVPVLYQRVAAEGVWSRRDNLAFYSGHVNLLVGANEVGIALQPRPGRVIDITPLRLGAYHQTHRLIAEETLVAMYLNNRAAESLVAGDLDTAYAWARAAVLQAPAFTSAWNTLAVVYRRHGDLAEAERALTHALAREPNNPHLLSNLVLVLENQLRFAAAEEIEARLRAIAPVPPFHFLDAGLAAAERGELDLALQLYREELKRMPYDDELHFAIAQAELRRGAIDDARRHIGVALQNSATPQRREIYAAKLDYLKGIGGVRGN